MEREILNLTKQIEELKRENIKTKMAANILFYSIVQTLDSKSPECKFSESLKENILNELGKINIGSTAPLKNAVNEMMQPPVKPAWGNQPINKFIE